MKIPSNYAGEPKQERRESFETTVVTPFSLPNFTPESARSLQGRVSPQEEGALSHLLKSNLP